MPIPAASAAAHPQRGHMSRLNFDELIQHATLDEVLALIAEHADVGGPDTAPDTDRFLPYRPTVPSQRDPYASVNSDPATVRSNQ